MARKMRAEVEGGLYHVITRGNNRRQIFTENRKDRRPDPDLFFSRHRPVRLQRRRRVWQRLATAR